MSDPTPPPNQEPAQEPSSDPEYLSRVKYAEEQVTKNLDFQFESMALLTTEAHSTLKWLFSLVIFPAGYAVTEIKDNQWWIVLPLAITSAISAYQVLRLINGALMAQAVPAIGNEPENIATPEVLAMNEADLRLTHTHTLQDRIRRMTDINDRKSSAVNHARLAIMWIPLVGLGTTGLSLIIWFVAPDLPCAFRL